MKVITEEFEVNSRYLTEGSGVKLPHKVDTAKLIEKKQIVRGTILSISNDKFKVTINGIGIAECSTSEISVSSCSYGDLKRMVGKQCDFLITSDDGGIITVSRKAIQDEVIKYFKEEVKLGSIIQGKILAVRKYGIKVDVGRGTVGIIRYRNLFLNKMDKYYKVGEEIPVIYNGLSDDNTVLLSTIELFGTWEDNIKLYSSGDTVVGYVKKISEFGAFITLAPNLTGLADSIDGFNLKVGDYVSVEIKSIQDAKMRIKLSIVSKLANNVEIPIKYFITSGRIVKWQYENEDFNTEECHRRIEPVDYNIKGLVEMRDKFLHQVEASKEGLGEEGESEEGLVE